MSDERQNPIQTTIDWVDRNLVDTPTGDGIVLLGDRDEPYSGKGLNIGEEGLVYSFRDNPAEIEEGVWTKQDYSYFKLDTEGISYTLEDKHDLLRRTGEEVTGSRLYYGLEVERGFDGDTTFRGLVGGSRRVTDLATGVSRGVQLNGTFNGYASLELAGEYDRAQMGPVRDVRTQAGAVASTRESYLYVRGAGEWDTRYDNISIVAEGFASTQGVAGRVGAEFREIDLPFTDNTAALTVGVQAGSTGDGRFELGGSASGGIGPFLRVRG